MRAVLFHRLETWSDTRHSQQDMSQCSTGLLLSKFVRLTVAVCWAIRVHTRRHLINMHKCDEAG
jgi:hypothetical protein